VLHPRQADRHNDGYPTFRKNGQCNCYGIFRVVDGKATDNWVNFDALGLLQQIGAVPNKKKQGCSLSLPAFGQPCGSDMVVISIMIWAVGYH
jgi:hypothetical protein